MKKQKERVRSALRQVSFRMKRFLAIILSVSLMAGGMPAISAFADEEDEGVDEEFTMELGSLRKAIQKSVDEEALLDDSKYNFTGAAKEEYENLFQQDDLLYEISPEVDDEGDGTLTLKVFAHLVGNQNLDNLEITGETELIFLLLNKGNNEQTANILIDNGKETGPIVVIPLSEVESADTQTEEPLSTLSLDSVPEDDEEGEDTEEDVTDEGDEALELDEEIEGTEESFDNETRPSKDKKPTKDDDHSNKADDKDNRDSIDKDGSVGPDRDDFKGHEDIDNNKPNERDNGKSDNKDNIRPDDKDNGRPDDKDNGEPDKKGNSGIDNKDKGKLEDKDNNSSSRSLRGGNLVKASLDIDDEEDENNYVTASSSNAIESISMDSTLTLDEYDDNEDDEESGDSDSYIAGEIYDPVIVNGNQSGVVFVTTLQDIGIDYIGGSEITDQETLRDFLQDSSGEPKDVHIGTLVKDITVEVTAISVPFAQIVHNTTLYLNGHTISVIIDNDNGLGAGLFRVKGYIGTDTPTFYTTFTLINGTIEGVGTNGSDKASANVITCDTDGHNITINVEDVTITNFTETRQSGNIFDCPELKGQAVSDTPQKVCDLNLTNCNIINNESRGIYFNNENGSITLDNCTFSGNESSGSGSGMTVQSAKSVSIKNESTFSDYHGSAVALYNVPTITISDSTFENNSESAGSSGTTTGDGGAALFMQTVGSSSGKISISNNIFNNNSAPYYGGAVYLNGFKGTMTFNKNMVSNNNAAGRGGGVYIQFNDGDGSSTKLDLTENTFYNNTVGVHNNESMGGGLCFVDEIIQHGFSSCDFSGNTFEDNKADENIGFGGGMFINMRANSQPKITFNSGTITGNSAWWGGGIAVHNDSHTKTTLQLNDAAIYNNTAARGGGIWGESASTLNMYDTDGGAIYNNNLEGQFNYNGNTYNPAGADIRLDGYGSDISGMNSYTTAYIAPRALGGYWTDWYNESTDALVNVGSKNNIRNAIGLRCDLPKEGAALAEADAKLKIYENTAYGVGGGIAYNGTVNFGIDSSEEIDIDKVWHDELGKELPDNDIPYDKVDLTLVRVDGDEQKDLETVTISSEENWQKTITDLPTNYDFTVREADVNGYKASYISDPIISDGVVKIEVVNTHVYPVVVSGEKIWDDNGNADGLRPESVTLNLYAEEKDDNGNLLPKELVESLVVRAPEEGGDIWPWIFEDLSKYSDEGYEKQINYSVEEEEVFGYEVTYSEPDITDDGEEEDIKIIITNTETTSFPEMDTEIVPDEEDHDTWIPETSAMAGEEIEFELGTHIPILPGLEDDDDSRYSYSLKFHEILSDGLSVSESSGYEVLLTVEDESYDISEYSSYQRGCTDGCTFEVTVDLNSVVDFMSGLGYSGGDISPSRISVNITPLGVTEQELNEATINIFFYAVLDDSVEAGQYTSTAYYEILYRDSGKGTSEETSFYVSEPKVATVSTYEIAVTVTDSENGSEGVEGVSAGIYYDEACTKPVERNGEAIIAESGTDGILNFTGLATGTYYVKQLEVPEGYELSEETVVVDISEGNGYIVSAAMTVTKEETPEPGPGPAEGGSTVTIEIINSNGAAASGVAAEIYDSEGNLVNTFTSSSSAYSIYLDDGTYTVRIVSANGYNFPQSEYTFTVSSGEATVCTIQSTNSSNTVSGSRHRSSGGGGGGSSIGSGTVYTGSNGLTGHWVYDGELFTYPNGLHPSNQYLLIDGQIYGFWTNGYAISFKHGQYYTPEAIAAAGYIPTAVGTWDLCGWWFEYSDGTYPHDGWAELSYNERSDWYYFDVDGWMVTGWLDWNGNTYYLHTAFDGTRGHMYTGWNMIDGYWYYFGDDGALLRNGVTPDGYMVDDYGRYIG